MGLGGREPEGHDGTKTMSGITAVGTTLSGMAVIGTIAAVWVFGI